MKLYDPSLTVPAEIVSKATDLKIWMEMHGAESVCGMGSVHTLQDRLNQATDSGVWLLEAAVQMQQQLADMTRERNEYRRAYLELKDAK